MHANLAKWILTAVATVATGVASAGYSNPYTGVLAGKGEGTALTTTDLASLTAKESAFRGSLASPGLTVDFEVEGSSWSFGNGLTGMLEGGERKTCDSSLGAACDGRYSIVPSDDDGNPISSAFWQGGLSGTTSSFKLSFNKAVGALGFYLVDAGDFGGSISIELLDGAGGTLHSYALSDLIGSMSESALQGSALYLSFVSDSASTDFSAVRFTSTGGTCTSPVPGEGCADVFALDRITAAGFDRDTPLPLPGTLALAGLGLLGLGLRRSRR